jgi:hypothetical protein
VVAQPAGGGQSSQRALSLQSDQSMLEGDILPTFDFNDDSVVVVIGSGAQVVARSPTSCVRKERRSSCWRPARASLRDLHQR